MSFADEYMALRAKRLAEIKETGKMQETPVEHTAPAGGGAVSDFGARYMALRQKRIADGYKTLTTPPDLRGRGPKAPFAIGSDPFGRKPVVEQIRKNDPQGEKYRAYYKTYNSGGADMLGLSQKISQATKRMLSWNGSWRMISTPWIIGPVFSPDMRLLKRCWMNRQLFGSVWSGTGWSLQVCGRNHPREKKSMLPIGHSLLQICKIPTNRTARVMQ